MTDYSRHLYGATAAPVETTGEEYLNSLAPDKADVLRKYGEGKLALNPRGTGSAPYTNLVSAIVRAYPDFDVVDTNKRYKTAQAFATGPESTKIQQINQLLSHAGDLSRDIPTLNNFNGLLTPLNAPVNAVQEYFGDPRQGLVRSDIFPVAEEMKKIASGAGGGNLEELRGWQETLAGKGGDINASQEQQKAYLGNLLSKLYGSLDSLNEKYRAGMGQTKNITDMLDPYSKEVLKSFQTGSPMPPRHNYAAGATAAPAATTEDDALIAKHLPKAKVTR